MNKLSRSEYSWRERIPKRLLYMKVGKGIQATCVCCWVCYEWVAPAICFQACHPDFHSLLNLICFLQTKEHLPSPLYPKYSLNKGIIKPKSWVNECQSQPQHPPTPPPTPDLATSSLSLCKQLSFSDCKKWILELTRAALPRLVRSCHGKQLLQDASWQTHSVESQVVLILRHSLGKLYPHTHLKPLTICWLLSGKMGCSLCFGGIW